MSLPAAAAAASATVAVVNPLDIILTGINSNPYFIGLMMLLLNIGGRFLSLEISKEQEKFLSTPIVRRFLLFAVLFVATRNIIIAAALTLVMILIIGYLFNENSEFCVWKSCTIQKPLVESATGYGGLTAEEVMILKRLQDKQASSQKTQEEPEPVVVDPTPSQVYMASLQKMMLL